MPIGPKLEEVQVELDPIITKLDISVSALRDALRGADAKTLSDLHAQLIGSLNISLSALRDALLGTGGKTLTDLNTGITNVDTKLGNRTSFVTGFITVTTAGTPVQGPNIAVAPGKAVVIAYHPDNTGKIGIGNSSANANLSTGTPFILSGAGQAVSLMVDNLNRIWVDASVNGEKVMYIVET